MTGPRRLAASLLAGIGMVAAVVAAGSWWTQAALLDSDRFGDRAAEALESGAVRDLLASEITGQVQAQLPAEARAVAPQVRAAIDEMVASPEFATAFSGAARDAHHQLLQPGHDAVVVDLSAASDAATEAVRGVDPSLARAVPPVDLSRVTIGDSTTLPDLSRIDDAVSGAVAPAALLAAAALAAAMLVAPDRARLARSLGLGVAAVSVVAIVALAAVPSLVTDRISDPAVRDAARVLTDREVADLRWPAALMAATGLVTAVSAHVWSRRPRPAGLVGA